MSRLEESWRMVDQLCRDDPYEAEVELSFELDPQSQLYPDLWFRCPYSENKASPYPLKYNIRWAFDYKFKLRSGNIIEDTKVGVYILHPNTFLCHPLLKFSTILVPLFFGWILGLMKFLKFTTFFVTINNNLR